MVDALGFTDELSKKAYHACSLIPDMGALLPSSAIWEIGVKVRKGKLDIGGYSLAKTRGLPLLTRDEAIRSFYDNAIW